MKYPSSDLVILTPTPILTKDRGISAAEDEVASLSAVNIHTILAGIGVGEQWELGSLSGALASTNTRLASVVSVLTLNGAPL